MKELTSSNCRSAERVVFVMDMIRCIEIFEFYRYGNRPVKFIRNYVNIFSLLIRLLSSLHLIRLFWIIELQWICTILHDSLCPLLIARTHFVLLSCLLSCYYLLSIGIDLTSIEFTFWLSKYIRHFCERKLWNCVWMCICLLDLKFRSGRFSFLLRISLTSHADLNLPPLCRWRFFFCAAIGIAAASA